jgi:hypothetical protein
LKLLSQRTLTDDFAFKFDAALLQLGTRGDEIAKTFEFD